MNSLKTKLGRFEHNWVSQTCTSHLQGIPEKAQVPQGLTKSYVTYVFVMGRTLPPDTWLCSIILPSCKLNSHSPWLAERLTLVLLCLPSPFSGSYPGCYTVPRCRRCLWSLAKGNMHGPTSPCPLSADGMPCQSWCLLRTVTVPFCC